LSLTFDVNRQIISNLWCRLTRHTTSSVPSTRNDVSKGVLIPICCLLWWSSVPSTCNDVSKGVLIPICCVYCFCSRKLHFYRHQYRVACKLNMVSNNFIKHEAIWCSNNEQVLFCVHKQVVTEDEQHNPSTIIAIVLGNHFVL